MQGKETMDLAVAPLQTGAVAQLHLLAELVRVIVTMTLNVQDL